MFIVNGDGEVEEVDPDQERMELADQLMQGGVDPTRAEDIVDGVELLVDDGMDVDRAAALMVAEAKRQPGSVMPAARKLLRIREALR